LVIPCLNEERYIEPLVREFLHPSPGLRKTIVIVDGGSGDRTREIACGLAETFSNVLVLDNPKRIQSAAVNMAVATYGGSMNYLIRIDAHAEYPTDYCEALAAEAESTGAAAVVVAMTTVGRNFFQLAAAAAQNSKLGNGGSAHRSNGGEGAWTDHGHHALMRTAVFLAVGGYDETFSHNEDAELDLRLRAQGYKIWLTRKTSLRYYARSTPSDLLGQYVNYGAGRARTLLKHAARPRLRQLAPAAILPTLALAVLTPFNWQAALPALVWLAGCIVYGLALGFRKRSLPAAASGIAAILMHLGWSTGFWRVFARRVMGGTRR
jgi:succinoglycan biosynthesis protein ExoA